jgi:hypothetical protein
MAHKMTEVHIAYLTTLERQGRMVVEEVLADAKREDSPLHDLYDWDVTKAAEAYWLDCTRAIIRQVRIVVHEEHHTYRIPKYVRDPDLHAHEQGYVALAALQREPRLAYRALTAEFERVLSSLRRARRIAIGLGLQDDVDLLLDRVAGLRTSVLNIGEPPPDSDMTAGASQPAA